MATTKKYPVYKYVLAAIDVVTIIAAYMLAFAFEERWLNDHAQMSVAFSLGLALFVLANSVVAVFIFHYLGMYQIHVFVTIVNHVGQLVKGLAVVLAGVAILSFFSKAEFVVDSRLVTAYFAVSAFVLLLVVRVMVFRWGFLLLARSRIFQRNVLILGAGENAKDVAANLFLHDYVGLRVVGFLDDDLQNGTVIFNGLKVLGKVSEMRACVQRFDVGEILICFEKMDHTRLMEIMEQTMSMNAIVKIASPLYEIIPLRRAIEHYGTIPVIGVFQSGITPGREMRKRVFDVVLASAFLLLLSPLLAIIAVLVKLSSPGAVLFRQSRVGRNGKQFQLFKFRSMRVGAENDEKRKEQMAAFIQDKKKFDPNATTSTKIINASHVTPIGKWLRKLSLDELPQLLNVLKGEMSLVGPRPCLPYEWDHYEEWHKRRLSVTPGLTGIWQVSGRSIVGFEDMVILDLHYIQNASLFLDIRLMVKTIPVMLFGTGAK
ncbi:MAG: sugar transferase [Ignavibacteriae bacterium]|nr:sugar transferase [Ignavibacteriota bacterium]